MRIDPIVALLVAVLLTILGFLAGCDWALCNYIDGLEEVGDDDGPVEP